MRAKIISHVTLAAVMFCLTQVCSGQTAARRVGREEAVKSVEVASFKGWSEAVSDGGRFRVLFPGSPAATDEPNAKGFELSGGRTKWFVLYYDFGDVTDKDEQTLRDAYKESVEGIASGAGSKLLLRRDVVLNGRLGVECILLGKGARSYMRAFQVGGRLYTLAVDAHGDLTETTDIPADVRRFFDSFTFWE